MSNNIIRVGTRKSQLALTQTGQAIDRLKQLCPEYEFVIKPFSTAGDRVPDRTALPFGQGIFVKELEEALLRNEIDLAVHSLKDMPCDLPQGLILGAVCERVNPQDALLSRNHVKFNDLKPGSRIGTSSNRRRAQVLLARHDLQVVDLRGNLDTRIRKLQSGEADAIIIAAAGISRLSLDHLITELLPLDILLPAPCQGALAIEIRSNDSRLALLVAHINHAPTMTSIMAERALLRRLGGGCSLPVGALATVNGDQVTLKVQIVSPGGVQEVHRTMTAPVDQAVVLGEAMADSLMVSEGQWLRDVLLK